MVVGGAAMLNMQLLMAKTTRALAMATARANNVDDQNDQGE